MDSLPVHDFLLAEVLFIFQMWSVQKKKLDYCSKFSLCLDKEMKLISAPVICYG